MTARQERTMRWLWIGILGAWGLIILPIWAWLIFWCGRWPIVDLGKTCQ